MPERPPVGLPALFQPARPFDEAAFRAWYEELVARLGLATDPDVPDQHYDYRAAFTAGAAPDASGHFPSAHKRPGHPNEVVGGFNTRTGTRVPGTRRAGYDELVRLGREPATARQLAAAP